MKIAITFETDSLDELKAFGAFFSQAESLQDATKVANVPQVVAKPTPVETPAPVVEEPAPVVEEPAPVVEEPAPVVEKSKARRKKKPAPVAEEPASVPVAEEPASVPAPVAEEPASVPAPVAEEPASVPAPVAEEPASVPASEVKTQFDVPFDYEKVVLKESNYMKVAVLSAEKRKAVDIEQRPVFIYQHRVTPFAVSKEELTNFVRAIVGDNANGKRGEEILKVLETELLVRQSISRELPVEHYYICIPILLDHFYPQLLKDADPQGAERVFEEVNRTGKIPSALPPKEATPFI